MKRLLMKDSEGHRKTVKDTGLQRRTRMTTGDSNEWTNDNIGWQQTADEGQRMKASG
jgi:hypothetical protein